MAFRYDGTESIALFGTDDALRGHILSVLEQSNIYPVQTDKWTDLEGLPQKAAVSVILIALSETTGKISRSLEDDLRYLIELLPRLYQKHPHCQVLLICAARLTPPQICQVVSQGIAGFIDYQQSDFAAQLLEHLRAAQDYYRERINSAPVGDSVSPIPTDGSLVGASAALAGVLRRARRAAAVSDAPVIIYGESGTGKQLIAETIHKLDPKRLKHNFVCVNCAAIAGTLAESELFGHRKGAFTGATQDRLGYFRAADGGTILLDEISELVPALQSKILRVLQEGLVMPVGSDKEYHVDVRVIVSTNRNLQEMVEAGTFRLDLFQRLNVIELRVPALRQRIEDIPLLVEAFLHKYAHYYPQRIEAVDPEVHELLARAIGAGNVRELENIVRRILVFKERGRRIEITDLPPEVLRTALPSDIRTGLPEISAETIDALVCGSKELTDAVNDYEKHLLSRLLKRGLSRADLAQRLGMTRRTLYNKLQKYNLE